MGFRLRQESLTLNDFERQFTVLWLSVMRIMMKRLKLESGGFHY